MAASKKVIDSANRLRYVRALERFHKSIISYLHNSENISLEGYRKKIDNALKVLKRVESIELYKGDLKELESFVKKIIASKESDLSIDEIRSDILYHSNQLDKSKNAKRYKKDKHVNTKYKEWE